MDAFTQKVVDILGLYGKRGSRACAQVNPKELFNQLSNLEKYSDNSNIVNHVANLYFEKNPNNKAAGNVSRLYTEPLPVAKLGAIIAILGNNSGGTFKSNPVAAIAAELVFTFMINNVYRRVTAEAIDTSGGMAAVNMGVKIARNFFYPNVKTEGMNGKKIVVMGSVESHYSVESAAEDLGIGTDNAIGIAVDRQGSMDLLDLERQLIHFTNKEYKVIIVSTMGTTVLGAVDNIKGINLLRDKYQAWHHVDGSWGGVIPFGENMSHIDDIHDVDSLSIDVHKAFRGTLTCGILMTKHPGILLETNYSRKGAKYLYNGKKVSSLDNGKRGMECGKPDRLLPMFLVLVTLKEAGLREMIQRCYDRTNYFTERVSTHDSFRLMHIPSFLNVCIQVKSPFSNITDSSFTEKVQEYIFAQKESEIMIELCHDAVSGEKVFRCIFIQEAMDHAYVRTFIKLLLQAAKNTENRILAANVNQKAIT